MQHTFTQIHNAIIAAARKFDRQPKDIQLLAVSKKRTIDDIKQAIDQGQRAFGENYLQEALHKISALTDYPLQWHFIGALQSNKAALVSRHFAWLHSLDSLKLAQRLSHCRPTDMPPLNVCVQINIDEEPSKAGILPAQLSDFVRRIRLPGLCLRGLMCLPKLRPDFTEQRQVFRHMHQLWQDLRQQGFALDSLSMGTSHDFVAAIAEGATIIRLGTALFGPREMI